MDKYLSTDELAELLKVKPMTIRTQYSRFGHYLGLTPQKMPNRRLFWPKEQVEKLLNERKG